MAIRKINVGQNKKESYGAKPKKTKAFKTLRMFKNIEELEDKASKLRKQNYEVIVNINKLSLQYRK
jgi:hypothetical protein